MKKSFIVSCFVLLVLLLPSYAQTPEIKLPGSSSFNFIIISDHGRNGYHNQKEVADMMGEVAE